MMQLPQQSCQSAIAHPLCSCSLPRRPISTCRVPVLAKASQRAQQAATQEPGTPAPPQDPLAALVNSFLNRASSSLTRGPATCLTCKGQGSCSCAACQGAGLLDKEHARMNMVRHTAQKFKQVLGVNRSNYDTEWFTTNRCRRCRGRGVVACPTCGGLGVRAPGLKAPYDV
eukprot:GHRR01000818.1.p1 GENE.GHRR01000818.1~~GHRR01000818.1.p1  ORF type:complete len:171 (+),score=32.81 GHRR01000818.1:250-762(+)